MMQGVPLLCGLCLLFSSSHAAVLHGKYVSILIGDKTFDVTKFGARGDGKHDDTSSIQDAFQAAANASGGTVLFPSGGSFMTRALQFQSSNTAINVEAGAQILFDDDHTKYDPQSGDLITSKGFNNIGLIGGGIIDGQGKKWWEKRAPG